MRTMVHNRLFAVSVVLLLLLGLTGGLVGASQEPLGQIGASTDNAYATCTATGDAIVTCVLKVVANQFSLDLTSDILPVAQQLNSAITTETVMWLQAWGGAGGNGGDYWPYDGGSGGDGGQAQIITSIDDFQSAHSTTTMYYYIGQTGSHHDSTLSTTAGTGGASTMVLLTATPSEISKVILLAGGGGGGGTPAGAGQSSNSGSGGQGGIAIATTNSPVTGAGANTCCPKSYGGNNGTGGGGGGGQDGSDGIGGQGGEVVDVSTPAWANGNPNIGSAGKGGPAGSAGGGAGGGGYGGGGPGDASALNNWTSWGGAGGGSFAAGSTRYDLLAPESYVKNSSAIQIVFNLRPVNYSFKSPVAYPFGLKNPGNITDAAPAFADLRNTGVPDAVIGDATGDLWHYPSASGPSYGTAQKNVMGLTNILNIENPSIAFLDVDQDDDPDAFVGDKAGRLWYFEAEIVCTEENQITHECVGDAALQFKAPVINPFGITTIGTNITPTFLNLFSLWDNQNVANVPKADGPSLFYGNGEGDLYLVPYGTGCPPDNPDCGPGEQIPQYGTPVKNPFGFTPTGANITPTFLNLFNLWDNQNVANVPKVNAPSLFYGNGEGDLYFLPVEIICTEKSQINNECIGDQNLEYGTPVKNPFSVTPTGTNIAPTFLNLYDLWNNHNVANVPKINEPSLFYGNGEGDLYFLPVEIVCTEKSQFNDECIGGQNLAFGTPVKNPFGVTPTGTNTTPAFLNLYDLYENQNAANVPKLDESSLFYGSGDGDVYFLPVEIICSEKDQINNGCIGDQELQYGTPVKNPFNIASTGSYQGAAPTFVDINDDGLLDAFVGDKSGRIWYYQNTGTATDPTFAAPVSNPFGITRNVPNPQGSIVPGTNAAPAFVDIDGDGDQDLFIGIEVGFTSPYEGTIGELVYQENTGTAKNPTFAAPVADPFGIEAQVGQVDLAPTFADMEGDGDQDLFFGDGNGNTFFQLNIGSSTAPVFDAPLANPDGVLKKASGNALPAAVDITGNGRVDLFVGAASGNLWYYENAGPITESNPTPEPLPAYDAAPELLFTSSGPPADGLIVTIYGGQGFDASQINRDITSLEDWPGNQLGQITQNYWSSALGDVNRDGYLDRTLTFILDVPGTTLVAGTQLCLSGVTYDGVTFRSCHFLE